MEALVALLFIVIIVLILNQNSKLFQQLQKIEKEIKQLKNNFTSFSAPTKEEDFNPVYTEPVQPPVETKPYESIFTVDEEAQKFVQPAFTENIKKNLPILI